MKKIKIDEQQDKQIRKSIKESLTEADSLVTGGSVNNNGGFKLPNGYEGRIDITPPKGKEKSTTDVLNNMATTQKTATLNGQHVGVEAEIPIPSAGNETKTVSMTESVIISKGQLDEIRLKKLKENSEMVKIENFLK